MAEEFLNDANSALAHANDAVTEAPHYEEAEDSL
jgi:hypothetical protein